MDLRNTREADEFLTEVLEAYTPIRNVLMNSVATSRCMYLGCQWLHKSGLFTTNPTTGRRYTNWNPDTNKLVATVNRIPPLIRECSAATYPEKMEVDISPPDRDRGIEAAERSRVQEAMLHAAIDGSGYLAAAKAANFNRCIDGSYGVGLRIKAGQRMVGREMEEDRTVTAFNFDVTKLTLDPSNTSRDLREHEYVVYSDVWTIEAIRRNFGIQLDPDDCQTIGELRALELQLNRLSENNLYADLPKYSKTKGAMVHQMHVRDDSGRFSTMLIGICTPPKNGKPDIQWVNGDNPETPFGGESAMPMMLLHGAFRPDSMWSLSDAHLLKDDQDRINLLSTFVFRILQKSAGYQWVVDKRSMIGRDEDNFRQQFNNAVAGVVFYDGKSREQGIVPPQMAATPQPPPILQELAAQYGADMRKMVHRHEVTTGSTKSHVPNSVYQTALDEANQVLGNRIRDDIAGHEALLETMLGTTVRQAQDGVPSALAMLGRAGFDETDFAQVSMMDPKYPSCSIKVRESSIRYQSREEKEARLWKAVEMQAVDPQKLRIALADMDTPLDDADNAFLTDARKSAMRVMLGEEWPGRYLGDYGPMYISEFRRATTDRRAKTDPEAMARLDRAIEMQMVYTQMEVQQQAMAQQPPAPMAEAAGPEAEMPQEVNLADLITSLQSGVGSPGGAQPVPA